MHLEGSRIGLQNIGVSVPRKEAQDKVTGTAAYTNDEYSPKFLHVQLITSPYAHAKIKAIDLSEAFVASGVRAILTGRDCSFLTGSPVEDRPALAVDIVRYCGEPVVAIVADTEYQAKSAAQYVRIQYEPLPVVGSIAQALQEGAPLIHPQLGSYKINEQAYPEPGTNIANRTKIRKGDMQLGWEQSEVQVEASFSMPQSDHAAMETRCAIAETFPSGIVNITTASQAPYKVSESISTYFQIEEGKVRTHTPLVGGGYGGKAAVQLEYIVYLASQAVEGRPVKLVNSREHDFISSPGHVGTESYLKIGATKEGKLVALEILHLFDGGAYSDRSTIISRAAAVDCTGPYRVDNVWCDSLCVYTNHPYCTSYRGFGHSELTFPIERTLDLLAAKLGMDPLELRMRNAILPGDTTPTQTPLTRNKVGNVPLCIDKLKTLLHWEEEPRIKVNGHKVRAKGVCCIWKNSSTPSNATSGAILRFHHSGSVTLICGAVEIGQGTLTVLTQILAERLQMDIDQVHVEMKVDTASHPEHWKTVASRSTYMVGNAVLDAAEDAMRQMRETASQVLKIPPSELEVGRGKVYVRSSPEICIELKDIVYGYKFPDGHSAGKPIIGRGSFIMQHIQEMDPETGKGNPGPEWTVGAQAVEVELDTQDFSYKILKAISVIDAGTVINPMAARGQITGGMNMGLSLGSREEFLYSDQGVVLNPQFRTYKMNRYSDHPEYQVEFVDTPDLKAPYGLRGIGEHGLIGMPAALANALSLATGIALNHLPLTPERIWKATGGGR